MNDRDRDQEGESDKERNVKRVLWRERERERERERVFACEREERNEYIEGRGVGMIIKGYLSLFLEYFSRFIVSGMHLLT